MCDNIYKRLTKLEEEFKREKDHSERMDDHISSVRSKVDWVTLAIETAAVLYGVYRLHVLWLKSIRAELEEEN